MKHKSPILSSGRYRFEWKIFGRIRNSATSLVNKTAQAHAYICCEHSRMKTDVKRGGDGDDFKFKLGHDDDERECSTRINFKAINLSH